MIELLVVIAIIAILAAILFPVFARARAKDPQTACLSNIKQLALAMLMYASDWDDHAPTAISFAAPNTFPGSWSLALWSYVKGGDVYRCPGHGINYSWNICPSQGEVDIPVSGYLANGVIVQHGGVGVQMGSIPEPASIVLLTDRLSMPTSFNGNKNGGNAWVWPLYRDGFYIEPFPITDWNYTKGPHNWGYNVAYCDGHAQWAGQAELISGDYGLIPGDSHDHTLSFTAAF